MKSKACVLRYSSDSKGISREHIRIRAVSSVEMTLMGETAMLADKICSFLRAVGSTKRKLDDGLSKRLSTAERWSRVYSKSIEDL